MSVLTGFEPVAIDRIEVGPRLREVDPDWVEALAVSIRQTGLRTPIQVRMPATADGAYPLIAGAHRLAACRQLGMGSVPCALLQASDLEARLFEIDENLVRRELSALDRATVLAERKSVYEALHPETKVGVAGAEAKHKKCANDMMSFAESVAEKIGVTPRTVQRAIQLYARLAPEVRARLATTRLAENQTHLLALSRLTPAYQAAAVERMLRPENPAKTVRQAVREIDMLEDAPPPDGFERLVGLWARTNRRDQLLFLDWLVEAPGTANRQGDLLCWVPAPADDEDESEAAS